MTVPILHLDQIRVTHIEIEKLFQGIGSHIQNNFCFKCKDVCCKEEICRESIESTFLSFILGDRVKEYDQYTGWFNNKSGCSAEFGRPFLCYEYFCGLFDSNSIASKLNKFAVELKQIYSNVYQRKNILVVDELNVIPIEKLKEILSKLRDLKDHMNAYKTELTKGARKEKLS